MGLGPQREALEALGFDIVVAEESELIATARRWHPDCVMTKLVYVVFVREVPRLSAAMIEQDRAGLERRARGLDSSALPNGFQKGVAVLSAYVADAVDSRVKVFSQAGAYLRMIGNGVGSRAHRLNAPTGVAVCGGRVWVADKNNRVLVFLQQPRRPSPPAAAKNEES